MSAEANRTVTAAQGTIGKLVGLVLLFVAIVVVGTLYGPFAQGYELKNAGKLACNDKINQLRFDPQGNPDVWKEMFLRRATTAGVNLKPQQYSLHAKHEPNLGEWACKVKITYPSKTDWWLVGPILDIPPLEQKKVLAFEHRVRDSY